MNDPFGGDFLEQLARTPDKTRRSRLGRIRSALRVAVPQLEDLELRRDQRGTPHLRGKYAHWRPQGAWQTEDHFSDGTLRLLGLLWASLDGTGTRVQAASELQQIEALLEGGATLAETVLPLTRPERAEQLMLFAD